MSGRGRPSPPLKKNPGVGGWKKIRGDLAFFNGTALPLYNMIIELIRQIGEIFDVGSFEGPYTQNLGYSSIFTWSFCILRDGARRLGQRICVEFFSWPTSCWVFPALEGGKFSPQLLLELPGPDGSSREINLSYFFRVQNLLRIKSFGGDSEGLWFCVIYVPESQFNEWS